MPGRRQALRQHVVGRAPDALLSQMQKPHHAFLDRTGMDGGDYQMACGRGAQDLLSPQTVNALHPPADSAASNAKHVSGASLQSSSLLTCT